MKSANVAVIGAGLGGLAVGIRLAAEGCRVRVFEKNGRVGGLLGSTERGGFLFNLGAEIVTAPFLFDQLFESVGRRRVDYFKLIETVPIFQALFPNGRRFAFYPTQEETLSLNVFWEESDQGALKTYLEENAANFDSLFFDYCGRVVDERFLAFRNNAWFRRLDVNQSCYELGKKTFAAPELGALFGFWPLLSGGDPRRSSRLFALLPELFLRWGATVPIGGMNRIVDSMAQLFQEMGGEIRLNAAVQNIQIMNKRATGVRLRDGSIQQADIVISDVDTLTTYRELIDSDRTKYESVRLAQERTPGMSAFVYFIGTKEILPERISLAGTNILFPENYEAYLDDVFRWGTLPDDPLIWFRIPTKTLPDQAPAGNESIIAIVPVPNTLGGRVNWAQQSYAYRDLILKRLGSLFSVDIRSLIATEFYIDPNGLAGRVGSYAGALMSSLPELRRDGQLRLSNRSKDIERLYLVGAGAHPGGSIPGVLLGAENTAEMIKIDFA